MLYPDENYALIQKLITEIKIALFKTDISDKELPISNDIVSILETDSQGNIWFYATCLGNYAGNVLNNFQAHLDFYQKEGAYRLRIKGEASVVTYGNMLAKFVTDRKMNSRNNILIQMKIQQAVYYENRRPLHSSSTFKTSIRGFFSDILFSQKIREFNFN